jgi:frataxin
MAPNRLLFSMPRRWFALSAGHRWKVQRVSARCTDSSSFLDVGRKALAHSGPASRILLSGFRQLCSSSPSDDAHSYDSHADETLLDLQDKLEDLVEHETSDIASESDVTYSNGVLTVNLGAVGTYVINKQSPNRQIWLSSPVSGPKRYDLVDGSWIYLHDGVKLYDLLESELGRIFGRKVTLK